MPPENTHDIKDTAKMNLPAQENKRHDPTVWRGKE